MMINGPVSAYGGDIFIKTYELFLLLIFADGRCCIRKVVHGAFQVRWALDLSHKMLTKWWIILRRNP